MTYLELPRARRVLLLLLTTAILFASFPALDLRVSRLFHRDDGFPLARSWWAGALHESVGWFVCAALATVLGVYLFNRLTGGSVGKINGRTVIYLLLVLSLGAGLIVNVILKDGFGRARPRNAVEFGGSQQFTAAFQLSAQCAANCSFASGDASGAFFSLAFALALGRRRAAFVAAGVYGALVSFSRIAAGAHFLSDTIVSLFVMWITADVLHFYLLQPDEGAVRPGEPVDLPAQPAFARRRTSGLGADSSYERASSGEATRGAR